MEAFKHLYEAFVPEHYDLFLDINRQTRNIHGVTKIIGKALTEAIALHQKDLAITSLLVNGKPHPFISDDEKEMCHIHLPETGDYTLTLTYDAPLTDTMMGIYPSYYRINGEKKMLIGTQFETNAAHQAFPCIDEPEAKATFDLAIKFDEQAGETIISNMPETHVREGIHHFARTRRMSTYLLAFGFGALQCKKTTTKSGVIVGVYATLAHRPEALDFALDVAKRSIEFYEDFFDTPYPLPHSWQLGLPDFSAGAMENWGLITYREVALLVDPEHTTLALKQRVATVIAHEVAHQWFGDLVTMKWWDDLWLNESFANMMEYVCVDAILPEFRIWEVFQTSDVPAALGRDATDGVQSVYSKVEDPAEVDALFDPAIVYAKGARMLVMVRSLIGDRALREGLKAYFAKHQYGNATGADLWDALSSASGIDLAAMMHSWLMQPGYPLVHAQVKDGMLTLEQKQFYIGAGKDQGRIWQIPLNSNDPQMPDLFTTTSMTLGDYASLRSRLGKPFRLNIGNNAHYIVAYDEVLLQDILAHANELDAISQLQLLQDLRLQATAGLISFAALVELVSRFKDSHSFIVLDAIRRQILSNLERFVTPGSKDEVNLRSFFRKVSDSAYQRLGITPVAQESNDDQLSRPGMLSAALYGEHEQAIQAAHQLYTYYQDDLQKLPTNTAAQVLANEVRHFNTEALFTKLITTYRNSADQGFRANLAYAITATDQPQQIATIIAWFKDPETIKPQDLRTWFYYTLANPKGEQAAWDWLRSNWQWLIDTVGGDMSFTSYITMIAAVFRTPQRLDEFKAFFTPKKEVPGLGREITMDTNVIESRIQMIQRDAKAVNQAIAQAIL